MVETAYAPDYLHLTETLMSLSNGYLGMRGILVGGRPVHQPGTFVNGFHETWPIVHPEEAYGLARTGQTIVNVPDTSVFEIGADGEPLLPDTAIEHRRRLDFRTGVLTTTARWHTPSGATIHVSADRLVSLVHRHLSAHRVVVSSDRPVTVTITAWVENRQDAGSRQAAPGSFDPRLGKVFGRRVLENRVAEGQGHRRLLGWTTASSRMSLALGVDHVVEPADGVDFSVGNDLDHLGFAFRSEVRQDRPLSLIRHSAYHHSPADDPGSLATAAGETLELARSTGWEGLARSQRSALEAFWSAADVEVGGDDRIRQAIRWSLFQLNQASALLHHASIPAKGLTGQAYDGHYFWDTDIFVMPFLDYTHPERARTIVSFRHSLLPAARARADELSQRGALYPWRTITGEEASAYFEAGTAQYHIDAAVAYAAKKYVEVTGDDELLWEAGVEMAVETARMWADLGFHRSEHFHIHGVTGPDEYSALVDDNAYTNLMARMNLRFASQAVERMRRERPEAYRRLAERIGLDDEPPAWRLAADAMYVPFDSDLGIVAQDDDFLVKEVWDFDGTPPERYPLLLHFHPLVIYRFQVLKQADVVMAMFLLWDEFDPEIVRATFDYYDPLTTGDSSLSASAQSIVAGRVGHEDLALEYFEHAVYTDIADLHGNTTDGVHLASAGGVWQALVYGFGGLHDHEGRIRLNPRLPRSWSHLRFPLLVRGARVRVSVTHERVGVSHESGPALEMTICGETHILESGDAVTVGR